MRDFILKLLFLSIGLPLLNYQVNSQQFFKKAYPPFHQNVNQEILPGNDFLVAANLDSNSVAKVVLYRFNSCGNVVWAKQFYNQNYSLQVYRTKMDANNNILIAGNMSASGERNAFLISVSPDGHLNFFKRLNTQTVDIFYSIDVSPQNEIFVFLNADIGTIGPNSNLSVAKLSSNGQLIWYKQYGFSWIWGQMAATSDGGMLISNNQNICKIKADGSVDWTKSFDKVYYSQSFYEIPNGYFFFRYSRSHGNFAYPTLIDKKGNFKWNGQLIQNFNPKDGHIGSNGNLIYTGGLSHPSLGPGGHIAFIEIDTANGNILQTTVSQEANFLTSENINELSNGHFIFSGTESLSLRGSLLVGKVNQSFSHLACLDTTIKLNYPIETSGVSSASQWSATNANLQLTTPPLFAGQLSFSQPFILCAFEPSVNLGSDTTICEGENILLKTNNSFHEYLWSTGESGKSITVSESGSYWVKAITNCGDTISDTIVIDFHPETPIKTILSPQPSKVLDIINFKLSSPKNFSMLEWTFGDGFSSDKNPVTHQYFEIGSFNTTISITDSLGCPVKSSFQLTIEPLEYRIPNVFSPNADGINDWFGVFGKHIDQSLIRIFNRWGKIVYESTDSKWDGRSSSGKVLPNGLYFYLIEFNQSGSSPQKERGEINLIR